MNRRGDGAQSSNFISIHHASPFLAGLYTFVRILMILATLLWLQLNKRLKYQMLRPSERPTRRYKGKSSMAMGQDHIVIGALEAIKLRLGQGKGSTSGEFSA